MDTDQISTLLSDSSGTFRPGSIFYSSELKAGLGRQMGDAHYSYGIVAARFAHCLRGMGIEMLPLSGPEKYKRLQDLAPHVPAAGEPVFLLSFRAPENLRPIPFAINICHFAWEFDRLKDNNLVSRPITENQVHMLSLMDEIWVPSRFTLDVLEHHGLTHCHLVPTPVCGGSLPARLTRADAVAQIGLLPALPLRVSTGLGPTGNARVLAAALQGLADHPLLADPQARIFLAICSPGDLRKNLLNLIEGFQLAARAWPNALLIVKLAVKAGQDPTGLFERLAPLFRGPAAIDASRVIVLQEFLDDAQMAALYGLADYYLNAAHAEGQNLPLLEAMAHGTLAVSTRNTAMRDYISDDNAVVIAARDFAGAVPELAGEAAGVSPRVAVADRFAIACAIDTALQLTRDAHASKVERSRAQVMAGYSETAIGTLAAGRLNALREARLVR